RGEGQNKFYASGNTSTCFDHSQPILPPRLATSTQSPCRSRTRSSVPPRTVKAVRSEEHTSELQSLRHLVCRLLLEKKKKTNKLILISKNKRNLKELTRTTNYANPTHNIRNTRDHDTRVKLCATNTTIHKYTNHSSA